MSDINSFYCPKCKAHSSLTDRTSYRKEIGNRLFIDYSVSECNNCNMHFIVARRYPSHEIISIFPNTLPAEVNAKIPEPIKSDFEEALVCESVNAYRGAAVLARRTLQAMCLDKGADKGKKLEKQIDELFEKNVITSDIKEWAHEVRYVGNDAAHPTSNNVSQDDARDILELLESMCEVLYVAPSRAAAHKAKRVPPKDSTDEAQV